MSLGNSYPISGALYGHFKALYKSGKCSYSELSITCIQNFNAVVFPLFLGAFVICWTPGQVVLLLDGLGCKSCNVLAVEKYFLLLAEINSVINAIVYSYRDNEMRSTFRKILCFPCFRTPKYSPASVKSSNAEHRILSQNGHPTMDSSL